MNPNASDDNPTTTATTTNNQGEDVPKTNLRTIIIDANNMSKLNICTTSCVFIERIQSAYAWFENRGHLVYVTLPSWKKDLIMQDPPSDFIQNLEDSEKILYSPSKQIGDNYIKPDYRLFVLNLTEAFADCIIVSNDSFKAYEEDSRFKSIVEEQVLMYTFVNHVFLPAHDPLGVNGPSLDKFLQKPEQSQHEKTDMQQSDKSEHQD